jgi:predicted RNA-binding protein associated with RNAse of E/G family
MLETVNKDGRKHEYAINDMQVYENYLHYKRNYVNHPYHKSIEYHLFPNENIGIYVLTQYKNLNVSKADIYKYYVDMVSVEKSSQQWIIKDLYLDFIIKCDGNYYVVDVDEFNDAIKKMEMDSIDISNALSGLDNILKGYYKSFDIDEFINSLINIYSKEELKIFNNVRRLHYGT